MRTLARKFLSVAAYHLRLWRWVYAVLGVARKKKILVVFTFHRITEHEAVRDLHLEYDRGLDKELFRLYLETILNYYQPVSLSEFLKILGGESEPPRHSALITFDDADADFLPNALPILAAKKCPAVMFAPTGYIETEKRFWHLRVSNLFANLDERKWRRLLEVGEGLSQEIRRSRECAEGLDEVSKRDLCRRLFCELDGMKQTKMGSVISALEDAVGRDYGLEIQCLGWEGLREIQEKGVEVESHSVTHRKMAELDGQSAERELVESKSALEERLGKRVEAFCYPAGSFNDETARLAERAGYSAAFTTQPGLCEYPSRDRFRLRRLTVYGADKYSADLFLGKLAVRSLQDARRPVVATGRDVVSRRE